MGNAGFHKTSGERMRLTGAAIVPLSLQVFCCYSSILKYSIEYYHPFIHMYLYSGKEDPFLSACIRRMLDLSSTQGCSIQSLYSSLIPVILLQSGLLDVLSIKHETIPNKFAICNSWRRNGRWLKLLTGRYLIIIIVLLSSV